MLPAGGADTSMQAPFYSMRMNYHGIASCSSYPCTRSPLYNMDSASMTFNSEADRNATLDSLLPLAAAEWNLEEQMLQVSTTGASASGGGSVCLAPFDFLVMVPKTILGWSPPRF